MKATLEFNLPDDSEEFEAATRAKAVLGAIREFDDWMRTQIKYATLPEDEVAVWEKIRDKLHGCFSDETVSVWD